MPQVHVHDTARCAVKLKPRELRVAYISCAVVQYRWNIVPFKHTPSEQTCERSLAREIHEAVRPVTAARIRQLASGGIIERLGCFMKLSLLDARTRSTMTRAILGVREDILLRYAMSRDAHREFRAACSHPSLPSFFPVTLFYFIFFFYSPRDLTSPSHGRATVLTRTATRKIKRDKGRQTWRVTYGVKCGDKNEKLRCQVIHFYAAAIWYFRARVSLKFYNARTIRQLTLLLLQGLPYNCVWACSQFYLPK